MFWRQIGGHLKKVETCSVGVTWGIGYDSTAWVYTGGWGSAFLKGILSVFTIKDLSVLQRGKKNYSFKTRILFISSESIYWLSNF